MQEAAVVKALVGNVGDGGVTPVKRGKVVVVCVCVYVEVVCFFWESRVWVFWGSRVWVVEEK